MGLLDSVMGAMGQQTLGTGGVGVGGPGFGSLQELMGMLGNNPQLMQAATSLLSNDGKLGGLPGLVEKFQQGGMGDAVASWVGSGANQAITGAQLSNILGKDTLSSMASQYGVNTDELASQLSGMLPGMVDQLTPNGKAPAAGLGDSKDLMGMFSGMFKDQAKG